MYEPTPQDIITSLRLCTGDSRGHHCRTEDGTLCQFYWRNDCRKSLLLEAADLIAAGHHEGRKS